MQAPKLSFSLDFEPQNKFYDKNGMPHLIFCTCGKILRSRGQILLIKTVSCCVLLVQTKTLELQSLFGHALFIV